MQEVNWNQNFVKVNDLLCIHFKLNLFLIKIYQN